MIGGMTVFGRRGTRAERCFQKVNLQSGGEERDQEPQHAPPEGGTGEAGERWKEAGLGANRKEMSRVRTAGWSRSREKEKPLLLPFLMMARL